MSRMNGNNDLSFSCPVCSGVKVNWMQNSRVGVERDKFTCYCRECKHAWTHHIGLNMQYIYRHRREIARRKGRWQGAYSG